MCMVPRIGFDLGEVWQDLKDVAKDAFVLWVDPKEAPPTIRFEDVGFVALHKKGTKESHGVFVPELYELAKVRGLKAQQEHDEWVNNNPKGTNDDRRNQPFFNALYHADYTPKSAFELSVLPVIYSDDDKTSARAIQKRVEDEFNNRIERGQPRPPVVFKYQISDYLKGLSRIGLESGGPRGIKLNLINPAAKTTMPERIAHYLAQRAALIVTLVAALSIPAGAPLMFGATALGVMLAKWCGEDFGTYDLAENLLRDIKSIFSKDFALGEKISLKKTLKTTILLGALGVATVGAASAGWLAIMSLPLWQSGVAALGLSVMSGLQIALAGFMGAMAGMGTFVGGTVAQRFFWGLGIWDKQIDFAFEKAPTVLDRKELFNEKLAKWERKLDNELKSSALSTSRAALVYDQAKTALYNVRNLGEKSSDITATNDTKSVTPSRGATTRSRARAAAN